ncbi:latexin isoform X2 [Hyperolius riggenbachi]|uniref:latexin isoform X2 n=1 Tax=Hyperolius riggenbachi TaxID=752182 RepID=UPI0035A3A18C
MVIPGVGNKYHLSFLVKDYLNESPQQPEMECNATVTYHADKKTPPDVTYTLKPEPQNCTASKDQEFYQRMLKAKQPLEEEDIPDTFGNVAPDMEPVWHLGVAATSFVKWKYSTEETLFSMTVIQSVKQLMREDKLELHYHMLIHDMVSEEMIPWLIEMTWSPSEGVKIKNEKRLPKKYEETN